MKSSQKLKSFSMVTGAWSPVIDPGSGDRCKSITKYDRLFTRNKQWFQQLGVTSENDLPATEFGVVGIDSTGVGRCNHRFLLPSLLLFFLSLLLFRFIYSFFCFFYGGGAHQVDG